MVGWYFPRAFVRVFASGCECWCRGVYLCVLPCPNLFLFKSNFFMSGRMTVCIRYNCLTLSARRHFFPACPLYHICGVAGCCVVGCWHCSFCDHAGDQLRVLRSDTHNTTIINTSKGGETVANIAGSNSCAFRFFTCTLLCRPGCWFGPNRPFK